MNSPRNSLQKLFTVVPVKKNFPWVGPNCSVILDGKKESLKYCMGCVNPYLRINIMDNGLALCKLCEYDPLTDKEYLKV